MNDKTDTLHVAPVSLDVKLGEVRVSDVMCFVDTPTVKVYSIDCRTKYCEAYTATGDTDIDVYLVAGDRSLRLDVSKLGTPTVLSFGMKEKGWMSMVEYGRYTVTICFYKMDHGTDDEDYVRVVWSDEE